MEVPWGRLLQLNGLNDLNEWTKRNRLPAISGLIVNVTGDRAWYPGGDYFSRTAALTLISIGGKMRSPKQPSSTGRNPSRNLLKLADLTPDASLGI
jgi:hypothetical protein